MHYKLKIFISFPHTEYNQVIYLCKFEMYVFFLFKQSAFKLIMHCKLKIYIVFLYAQFVQVNYYDK